MMVTDYRRNKYFSGLAARNSLQADLRTVSDIVDFKNKLKTHLFIPAFDIQ